MADYCLTVYRVTCNGCLVVMWRPDFVNRNSSACHIWSFDRQWIFQVFWHLKPPCFYPVFSHVFHLTPENVCHVVCFILLFTTWPEQTQTPVRSCKRTKNVSFYQIWCPCLINNVSLDQIHYVLNTYLLTNCVNILNCSHIHGKKVTITKHIAADFGILSIIILPNTGCIFS